MTKNCNLCKIEVANKPNSHIIPKFMSKRLFEKTKPRHTVQLNRDGKKLKLQDTPKENNILCSNCEKKISVLETYFSRVLIEINSLQNAKRNYSIINQYQNEIIVCEDLHPDLFKLFIYSIIWRCSISSLLHFETFKLPSAIEEEIRQFLAENLKLSHKQLMTNLENIIKVPEYHTCLIKPKNKTRGIFTAYNFGKDAYAIYTVDYALLFYISEIPFIERHQLFSNRDNGKVRIVNGNDEDWKTLNQLVVSKMLKK